MRRLHIDIRYDSSNADTIDPTYTSFIDQVPCNIVERGGREHYRGRQLQAETTHIIETRYYAGIKPNMIGVNCVSGEQYLFVTVIDTTSRQRYLMIEATEVIV